MFKGKISIWLSVLGITVGIYFVVFLLTDVFAKDTLKIVYTPSVDTTLSDYFYNYNLCKFNFEVSQKINETSDVIVTSNNELESIKGYTKVERGIYTPIVLYANANIYDSEDLDFGFVPMMTSNMTNYSPYKVDIQKILVALKESKNWNDIGVNKKIYTGPVTVVIPDESSVHYTTVVNLFYLILNDFKEPSAIEKNNLKSQVDLLLSKCEKSANINQAILNYKSGKTKENNKVFLTSENFYASFTGTRGTNPLGIFYLDSTISTNMDVYLKNESEVAKKYFDCLLEHSKFLDNTGYRVLGSTYEVRGNISRFAEVIPGLIQ